MANWGQTGISDLVEMLRERAAVPVRLVVLADGQGQWRLHHATVTLDEETALVERAWRYAEAAFLELVLSGELVAGLLVGGSHDVHGTTVVSPEPPSTTASAQRLRGQEEWTRVTTPWPRTEWSISRDTAAPDLGRGVLIGVGPSFADFDQALSAFLYRRPHDSTASRSDLWRIVLPQRAGWFMQITIAANSVAVHVAGDALEDAVLELSTATGVQVQPAVEPGTYRFDLPRGLEPDSLLVLRRKDQWLDLRTFPAPAFGRARDASVVWEQPGPELEILLSGGEGQHLECKREVPRDESRRKMLKTVAAFASQDGGTVLIGVQDDLEIVGLPDAENIDKQTLAVVSMIRDTIEPVPPYTTRVIDHEGKKVLAVEVSGGGQMYAYRNGTRLEFYVRVGPNTVPARHHEIAAGFQQS